ncbi:zinc-ribbon domain-containing protein [Candidatus Poribacteria bacterium]
MNALLKSLIMFLYPAQCRHCGESLDPADGHYICKSCWQQIELIGRPYCETCGRPLDPLAALPEVIPSCDDCPDNLSFRKARSVTVYESAAGAAFRLLKYHGKTVMAKPLADLMLEAMPGFFGMEDYDHIIPVPLHKKRRRKRGYNQVELIGEWLSRATNIPMETQSLVKTVNTPPQVGLPYEERQRNVRGHFDVVSPPDLTGKRVLLIDDVFTTGATAGESARTLLRKGKAEYVDVFTLLRVVSKF